MPPAGNKRPKGKGPRSTAGLIHVIDNRLATFISTSPVEVALVYDKAYSVMLKITVLSPHAFSLCHFFPVNSVSQSPL